MRKFLVLPILVIMLFVFSGFLTNCPGGFMQSVNQPNNLCQKLLYGSDLWAECAGLYGSDGDDAALDAPSAPPADDPPEETPDDCLSNSTSIIH